MMEHLLEISLGLGLAAACGLRVFLPLTVLAWAAQTGQVPLGSEFQWLHSPVALGILSVATVVEVAAYYIPFVDNALDALATPAATVAGTLVAAATMGEVSPAVQWTLAAIAGGGLATGVQVGTVKARALASVTTAGIGNSVLSTAENGTSLTVALLAVLFPFLALGFFLFVTLGVYFFLRRRAPAPETA